MAKLKSIVVLICLGQTVLAQENMSLQQAIELGLKNNYSISIARNQAEIEKNNFTYGNAGFLPQAGINASGNFSDNDTRQKYSTGLEVNKDQVKSNGLNTGLALSWTLFDGMKMFATYDKLGELKEKGELAARQEMENTVSAIIQSYFDIVRQKQLQKTVADAIGIYEERVKIAEARLNLGSGNRADLLQAKVDLNEQRSGLMKQKTAVADAKARLNRLLARDVNTAFDVPEELASEYNPAYDELKTNALRQNTSLLIAQRNINIAGYALKEVNSLWYPRIGVNASYNFSRSENQAGFMLLNQNKGLNAGFIASWTLFNGFNTRRQNRNAKLDIVNYQLLYAGQKATLEESLAVAFNKLQDAREMVKLEEESTVLAKENTDIALERFRLGSYTSLELKEAQRSYLDAQSRLVLARYDARIAEAELKRLDGTLITK